jgi:hypothetical protein
VTFAALGLGKTGIGGQEKAEDKRKCQGRSGQFV